MGAWVRWTARTYKCDTRIKKDDPKLCMGANSIELRFIYTYTHTKVRTCEIPHAQLPARPPRPLAPRRGLLLEPLHCTVCYTYIYMSIRRAGGDSRERGKGEGKHACSPSSAASEGCGGAVAADPSPASVDRLRVLAAAIAGGGVGDCISRRRAATAAAAAAADAGAGGGE